MIIENWKKTGIVFTITFFFMLMSIMALGQKVVLDVYRQQSPTLRGRLLVEDLAIEFISSVLWLAVCLIIMTRMRLSRKESARLLIGGITVCGIIIAFFLKEAVFLVLLPYTITFFSYWIFSMIWSKRKMAEKHREKQQGSGLHLTGSAFSN